MLVTSGCRLGWPVAALAPLDRIELPAPQLNPDLVKTLEPSNDRDWSPDQARLAYVELLGDRAKVHNVRRCVYRSIDDYDVHYYDKTYDLDKLKSVDFIVVPFEDLPSVAHTMLSFGFEGGEYLAVSVEIRRERGEEFNALKGFLRQYELIYNLADERDLIQKYAIHYKYNVYVYRTRATPQQARELLVDVINRVNKLVNEPEFYDTLTNNCTTNIRRHINRLAPDRVPYDYRVLLPGNSDKLAYDLGLLQTDTTFDQTKRRARVNNLAYIHRDSPDFSVKIRPGSGFADGIEPTRLVLAPAMVAQRDPVAFESKVAGTLRVPAK